MGIRANAHGADLDVLHTALDGLHTGTFVGIRPNAHGAPLLMSWALVFVYALHIHMLLFLSLSRDSSHSSLLCALNEVIHDAVDRVNTWRMYSCLWHGHAEECKGEDTILYFFALQALEATLSTQQNKNNKQLAYCTPGSKVRKDLVASASTIKLKKYSVWSCASSNNTVMNGCVTLIASVM